MIVLMLLSTPTYPAEPLVWRIDIGMTTW